MTGLKIRIPRLHRLRVLALLSISSAITTPAAQSDSVNQLVASNSTFALDLYAQLKSNPGNLFFSPYSISTCLAMTYVGARGKTESQMARVLHFFNDQQQLHSSFGELQRQLVGASQHAGIELAVANGLWAQSGHAFSPAFLDIARGEYQANVNQASFRTEADSVAGQINRWIAQRTNDKIQNILSAGSLNCSNRLVLANAIYFKGTWANRFKHSATSSQPFHLSPDRKVDAYLMQRIDTVRYMENGELQAVELPYCGNDLAMVILLSRQASGIAQVENRLTTVFLNGILSQLLAYSVQIYIPRFKLESQFDLSATMAKMGIRDALSEEADFSGIDGTRLLYISGLIHKAMAEVNEEGTEAAAGTIAAFRSRGGSFVFRADHPFIFFIHDTRSGNILFLGRLVDPTT